VAVKASASFRVTTSTAPSTRRATATPGRHEDAGCRRARRERGIEGATREQLDHDQLIGLAARVGGAGQHHAARGQHGEIGDGRRWVQGARIERGERRVGITVRQQPVHTPGVAYDDPTGAVNSHVFDTKG
jgi:hypothetical protein